MSIVTLLLILNSCSETTRQYREARINYDSLAASTPKSDTLTFINKEISDTNSEYHYIIYCNYPELIHFENESIKNQINNAIENKLYEIIDLFKLDQEYMIGDTTGMNLPEDFDESESRTSTLFINYEVVNNSRDITSLIFNIGQYIAFAIHPITYHKTMNIDMSSGEMIDLSFFIPVEDTMFIQRLSEISYQKINALNVSDSIWISNGVLPIWDNFKNYNITRDSLTLTFDVYQVAPYSVGPVRISIPWTELIDSTRTEKEPVEE